MFAPTAAAVAIFEHGVAHPAAGHPGRAGHSGGVNTARRFLCSVARAGRHVFCVVCTNYNMYICIYIYIYIFVL
jgi:hypothetical protein